MNLKKLMFPTDFSALNAAALDYASRLAAESGARLYIVHVDDRFILNATFGEPAYLYTAMSDDTVRDPVRNELMQIKPTVAGVTFVHQYLEGMPTEELLQFAKRENVDLIVMGSHGRTGVSRLLMGSVAEALMRRAECPILVVKEPVGQDEYVFTSPDLLTQS